MHRHILISLVSLVWSAVFAGTAGAQFSTGFEAPPYTSGTINGQDGWTSTTPDAVRVLSDAEIAAELSAAGLNPDLPVHSGSQALFVTGQLSGSTSIRAVPGLDQEERVVLDVWVRPLAPGTAGSTVGTNVGNVFLTMEDHTGIDGRSAGFRFGAGAEVSIDYYTDDLVWVPSGVLWDPNSWFQITLDANYTTRSYDFFINGEQINEDPIPFRHPNSENFTQLRIFRGTGQAGMIVDDLDIFAPGAVPLLPGDANRDGRVDGEDFLIWQASFGIQSGGTWDDGDFNGDGRVDGEDFLIWQAHFGSVAGSTALTPEPAGLGTLLALLALVARRRRG